MRLTVVRPMLRSWMRIRSISADSIYFKCSKCNKSGESSQTVALSATTGQTQWQVQISPRASKDLPIANTTSMIVTFRKQAMQPLMLVGLDHATGKERWTVLLNDDRCVDSFRSIVAAEGDRLFVLGAVPRWQT